MNNLKSLFVFLLLSLSSLAALAMPSVADVETTIASGDYAKAKMQINEVLKANPNSYVANRYMLEIIRIENARDNQPSVGYKIYEDKLKQIEKAKADRLVAERKVKEEKEAAERKAAFKHGVWTFFKVIFWALVFVGIGFIIVIFMRKQRIKKERQRELDALEEWKGDVRPDLIDFNAIFKRVLGDLSSYNLSPFAVQLLRDLDLDNLDYINDLDINKFDTNVIERHIGNAKDFIEEHGLNT